MMPFGVPDFHALHIEQGMNYFWRNDFETALVEFDQALQIRESPMARFDRAHTLLSLGRYAEGWRDFTAAREEFIGDAVFTESGRRLRKNLPKWNGEPGHRVVLLHEAGFGDTIMFLRFKRLMRQRAPVSVVLDMPEPLRVFVSQLAPIGTDGDCWLPLFDLPALFDPVIPAPPYLRVDEALVAYWRSKIANGPARRIGIAWSSNTSHTGEHELYQMRSVPLELFRDLVPFEGELYSLQHHDRDDAKRLGVNVPEFQDFADVAALVSLMDVIVSVDTALLHVAGAIGHANTYAILPAAPTWRWHAGNRWYPQIKLCKAREPGDWPSAFAQIGVTP